MSVVQKAKISGTTSPLRATFASAPTPGNSIVVLASSDGDCTLDSGLIRRFNALDYMDVEVGTRTVQTGDGNSWGVTFTGSLLTSVTIIEVPGTYDSVGTNTHYVTNTGTSIVAPTLTPTATGTVLALVALSGGTNGTPTAFSVDNGFTFEDAEVGQADSNATQYTAFSSKAGTSGVAVGATTTSWTNGKSNRDSLLIAFGGTGGPPDQSSGPSSDITTTGWSVAGGTGTFASALDETPPDDADFVTSPINPSSSVFEVKFPSFTDPVSSSGHSYSYRIRVRNAASYSVVAGLYQGTTLKASHTHTSDLTTAWQTFTFTLSGAEADSITDYTDLRLRVTATAA